MMKRLSQWTVVLILLIILTGCAPATTTLLATPTAVPVPPTSESLPASPTAVPAPATRESVPVAPTAPPASQGTDVEYQPTINVADFVAVVDNPYFPHLPGTKMVYEGQTEEGLERIEIEVLSETKEVMGIPATVMRDTVYLDGVLIEDTFDWFAQDKAGTVWYFGEDVTNYENGTFKDKHGSWEAGVDGALPGIVMFGDPTAHLGETYRQEYYKGEAEDMADLLSVSESVTVPYGSFDNVVQTQDYTPLEPDLLEHKYYAQGIGAIKTINLTTGIEIVLIEFTPPEESTTSGQVAEITLPTALESERVDLATPVFSNPTHVTNPPFPIKELHSTLCLGMLMVRCCG